MGQSLLLIAFLGFAVLLQVEGRKEINLLKIYT